MRISIAGLIGCGKSTLIKNLNQNGYSSCDTGSSESGSGELTTFEEPVKSWTFLDRFYKDMNAWSYPLQLQILLSFLNLPENIIIERSPWESLVIFSQMAHDDNILSSEQFDSLKEVHRLIAWEPDFMIYLKVDPDTCIQRIKQRARSCEMNIDPDYIRRMNSYYESELSNCENVFIVDASQDSDVVTDCVIKYLKTKIF